MPKYQLPEIRQDLADTAAAAIRGQSYPTVKEALNPPCVVVQLGGVDYSQDARIKRNIIPSYELEVVLIAGGRTDYATSETRIGTWLDPDGDVYRALGRCTTGSVWIGRASELRLYQCGDGEYLGVELHTEVIPNVKE